MVVLQIRRMCGKTHDNLNRPIRVRGRRSRSNFVRTSRTMGRRASRNSRHLSNVSVVLTARPLVMLGDEITSISDDAHDVCFPSSDEPLLF